MSNLIKKAASATAEFVSEHRVAIAVVTTATATAAAMVAINRSAVAQWNEFLDEKGLTEEFYGLTEEFTGIPTE